MTGAKRLHRRSTSIRIRARVAAVELVLDGVPKPTLLQIASRIGRSERTLVDKFRVRDAVFAFPPPELAPNIVDAWLRGRQHGDYNSEFKALFTELDANPIAKRLLAGLATLHQQNDQLLTTDGFFSHALRQELLTRGTTEGLLEWPCYIASILRNLLLDCETTSPLPVGEIVEVLSDRLRMIDRNLEHDQWRRSIAPSDSR